MTRDDRNAIGLTLIEAAERIAQAVVPLTEFESVPLKSALDRVLARDLISHAAVPAHDNSAMDGYALRSDDVRLPARLRIVGHARAGDPYAGKVGPDQCVRILTGAVIPADCDAVVAQERVVVDRDFVTFNDTVHSGQNRRRAGEDLQPGAIVLARGRRITAADLGLAASIGTSTLEVVRRLRIAVFSTGDELRDVDEAMVIGSVRDANRYTIIGMLMRLGVEVADLGIVRDDPVALEATLRRACDEVRADAIVTSGGVSAGDADYTRDVMARIGAVSFWTLAVKPGRPMAFGRVTSGKRSALLFGLPGNPVAVMVSFYALVRGALQKMMGTNIEPMMAVPAICDAAIAKAPTRTEFIRAIASREGDGWHVRPTGSQGSGVLRSMHEANCLIVLEHDRGPVAVGENVETWPFQILI